MFIEKLNEFSMNIFNFTNALEKSKHRGPDNTKWKIIDDNFFGFHRLAIHGLTEIGDQPLSKSNTTVICNGEIYNYKELADSFQFGSYMNKSDCEIIIDLIQRNVNVYNIANLLDGVFAFVLVHNNEIFAARDPIGVRPLFYGYNGDKICFASEIKSLLEICDEYSIKEFPPGHYFSSSTKVIQKYTESKVDFTSAVYGASHPTLQNLLISAVEKRLDSERPIGFFLSGGLDSSLIASIGTRLLNKKIHTFSIGIKDPENNIDSPDLIAARTVAKYLDSNHTEIYFTIPEALEALETVIYQLESYDCTTIRASVPMYILSKYVKENTDIRVILSGEGADELFGGYLYFHNAPNNRMFHEETQHLLENVHKYDVLRADRCTAGNGLELRVPFFDKAFRNYINHIDPEFKKTKLEKQILRDSFKDFLPESILYRQKNGMSDAVGYNWIDSMRKYTNKIPDQVYTDARKKYPKNEPQSKEELFYRNIYSKFYTNIDNLPHIWRPKYTDILDPSAKLLNQFTQ